MTLRDRTEVLLDQQDRRDGSDRDQSSAEEEAAPDSNQFGKKSADQGADQVAAEGARRKHPKRPAGLGLRNLRADHHDGRGAVAADETGEEAQHDELRCRVGGADERHEDRHADSGTHEHDLASIAVREPTPDR